MNIIQLIAKYKKRPHVKLLVKSPKCIKQALVNNWSWKACQKKKRKKKKVNCMLAFDHI